MDVFIKRAVTASGGLIRSNFQVSNFDKEWMPEDYLEHRLKTTLKREFGDYVVRNKITMERREIREEHATRIESTLLVFTPEQLMDFLARLGFRLPEELSHEDDMGVSKV